MSGIKGYKTAIMKYSRSKSSVLICAILLSICIGGCMDYNNYMMEIHNGSKQKITVLHSNSTMGGKANAWHQYIEEGKHKHLYLFIFSVDTLKKYDDLYSMDQLSAMGKYLKVLKYSEPELIKMNWKVNYNEN
jgi:hypothetical protein